MNGGTIDGERVLSERMADEMLAFQSRLDEPNGRIRRIEGFGLAWFRGTFRGRPGYCQHGGGYIGTAAHFSFLKDHGIGVVILANAAPAGQAFMDVASIDIYDRLLGHEPEFDLLPRYIERIEGFRQRLSGMNIDSEPADDRALSQPLHAYTGVYSNPWWGDVFVELENDALTARIGEMPLTVSAGDAEDDVVIIEPDFDTRPARFVVDDRGRITALELFGRRDDGKAIEFVRQ
jgi:CubicO group peptidase (beta-lactamase class C family)